MEIRPVVTSINGLFSKVESARQHEREITAFAAHELRTPLAGLRTQAQIAIATTDSTARDTALGQILVAVDRSTRLVRQLPFDRKTGCLRQRKKGWTRKCGSCGRGDC
jgi:two-component system, OmpR family, sensor histidine kinase QseC